MKHLFAFLFLLGITFSLSAQSVRERILLDDGWQFAFGNASSPEKDFGCGTEYFNYLTSTALSKGASSVEDTNTPKGATCNGAVLFSHTWR